MNEPMAPPGPATPFRVKSLAALLAFAGGALGLHHAYLGRRRWWLPLLWTALALPWLIGVAHWYQRPAFFVAMIPVIAGFIEALVLSLMTDARFDARFNCGSSRANRSGWDAVLVAIATLMAGAIITLTAIVLLVQTLVEQHRARAAATAQTDKR
jgi:hypothetical protein